METVPRVVAQRVVVWAIALLCFGASAGWAQAQDTLTWKGVSWTASNEQRLGKVTEGQIASDAANVEVDAEGGLHLRLSTNDNQFKGAALVAQGDWGWGTYSWELEGPVDAMESQVVFGISLSESPQADRSLQRNEIDLEFTRWSSEVPGDNISLTVYPARQPVELSPFPSLEQTFTVDLKQAARLKVVLIWEPKRLTVRLINVKGRVIEEDRYVPEESELMMPKPPLNLGFRLWSYRIRPSLPLDLVVRNFTFLPLP